MKKKRWYLILILAVLFAVFAGILLINKTIKINPFFAGRYELCGVDVSHYQGMIDWEKLAGQDLDFAFIKATEGSSYLDECFYDNWRAAEKTELYLGAYHFFSFDSDGKKQAEFFINTVGDLEGKLAPVIDVEFYGDKAHNPPKKEEVAAQLGEMLSALEEHYQIKPIIYTTYTVYNKYIKGEFQEYPLWIRNVYYPPDVTLRDAWSFWQYTDTAVLEGYKGTEKYIDMNVFHGTKEELEALIVRKDEGNGSIDEDQKESFWIYNEADHTRQEISLASCNLWYDNGRIKVYAYFGMMQALFIQTSEREEIICPVCSFWIDQEGEAIWILENKETIQVKKVDLQQDNFLSQTLILDQEELEALISNVYGLTAEKGKKDFLDLTVDLSGKKEENGETVLGGRACGVYKGTDKSFHISYEINRESGAVSAKGYLQNLSINPLYQEFLFHNLTVETPVTERNAGLWKELSYFDDETHLAEAGDFNKQFALIDRDSDGKEELIFCMKKAKGEGESIYVLEEQSGQLVCQNVFFIPAGNEPSDCMHLTPVDEEFQYESAFFTDESAVWFDCADFLDIPTEKCKEPKSREEVFDAVESGDFSVITTKYSDPDGLVEELKSAYEMYINWDKTSARMERCDINGDGFEELLFLVKYDLNDFEQIEFILSYRNGRAICSYYDWCDGSEWLSLGDKEKLIHNLYSNNGFCAYSGYYGCTLNAKGIKDIDNTGYGLEICNVYSLEENGLWWWTEQLPEITREGIYYVRVRAKTAEEIERDGTAEGMIKELISKDEFLEEYKEMTGKERQS